MPSHGVRTLGEFQTRNAYTKVNFELGVKVDGRELPSLEVLGSALEAAVQLFQERISEVYTKVPERV